VSPLQPWKVLEERLLLQSPPWLEVWAQRVRLPDGREVEPYLQVRMPSYVIIYAETEDGRVILERQYRHGLREVTLALPGGLLEPGEHPLEAARRELREETGYEAQGWQWMGAYTVSANYGAGTAHMVRGWGARRVGEPSSGDLEEVEVVLLTPEEVAEAVRRGEIRLLSTLACLGLALNPALRPTPDGGAPPPAR